MRELRRNPFDAGGKTLAAARVHFHVVGLHATFAGLQPIVRHQPPAACALGRHFGNACVIDRIQPHADGLGGLRQRVDGFVDKREDSFGAGFEFCAHDLACNVADECSHFVAHLGSICLLRTLEARGQCVDRCGQRIESGAHVASRTVGAGTLAGGKSVGVAGVVTGLSRFVKQLFSQRRVQLRGEQADLVRRGARVALLVGGAHT
nr:hypothetical protein [Burkholderia dolosa]